MLFQLLKNNLAYEKIVPSLLVLFLFGCNIKCTTSANYSLNNPPAFSAIRQARSARRFV